MKARESSQRSDGQYMDSSEYSNIHAPSTQQNVLEFSSSNFSDAPSASTSFISTGSGSILQHRENGSSNYQPTLGQIADQFQERARAEARLTQSSMSDTGNSYNSTQNSRGGEENYDYGSTGGGGGNEGFDDDDDGEGVDGDEDPTLISTGNESTGRWTRPEHELFLQALKKYGKEWKKVASMVKTRTVVQTRTHAQKYFQKLSKTTAPASGVLGGNFIMSPRPESFNTGGNGSGGAAKCSGLFFHKQSKQRGKQDGAMGSGGPLLSHMGIVGETPSALPSMHPSMLLGGVPGNSMMNNYMPTTQGYGEIDAQDYYEAINLASLVGDLHKTPASHMQTSMSLGIPMINTSVIGPPDFPEPSPAACGKRKHAELQAAQMLAASSSATKSRSNAELQSNSFGDLAARDKNQGKSTIKSEQPVGGGMMPGSRRNRLGLTLSIVDPADGGFSSVSSTDPGTPWENAIQVLEQKSAATAPISRLMRSNSFSNYTMPAVPVSTPSEQRHFITKVRSLVQAADLAGFASLLGAAEYSAQSATITYDDSTKEGNQQITSTVSSLGKTVDQASNKNSTIDVDSDLQEPPSPTTAKLRREEEINTQLNSVSSRRPGSVSPRPLYFSASLVAKSLNRIERNSRSVLMDVAATSDPAINQTLLYSMCMLLIEHGALPSLTDSIGNTALHFAAEQGHERIGRLLLTKGCPINLQNLDGDTATHIAARHGRVAFIEMLADLGANFHLRNALSKCALDLLGSLSKDSAQRSQLRKIMLTAEPRLRTLVLYHEDFLEHTVRSPSEWEGPDRLEAIMKRLRDTEEFPEHEMEISNRFEKADVELLGRVHSSEYIAFVNKLSKQVQQEASEQNDTSASVLPFTPQVQRFVRRQQSGELKNAESCDTSFSTGTLSAARRAAGAVAHAVDRVMLGRNRNVFCAVRPPGHHAGYRGLLDGANSCGFCIFNSVAAGALHALVEHQCERVAIIDLDVHHGNGTEDIVRRYAHPSRLFFFSLHLYDKNGQDASMSPGQESTVARTTTDRTIDGASVTSAVTPSYEFYPGTGVKDDHIHNIINVPITPLWAAENADSQSAKNDNSKNSRANQFIGREGYRQAIELRLIPSLRAFNPTLVLLSCGFDAAAGDVGNTRHFPGEAASRMGIDLLPGDFAWATTEIMKIADICCSGRLVSVLEGGYGEYTSGTLSKAPAAATQAPTTRGASRQGNSSSGCSATNPCVVAAAVSTETEKKESMLSRGLLGKVAVAHVHRLIDPYGSGAT